MKTRAIIGASFAILAGLALAPGATLAQHRVETRGELRTQTPQPFVFRSQHQRQAHVGQKPFVNAPFGPAVIVAAPGYDTAADVPPPMAPPAAAPTPDIIEFPEGRYELRGDGINTPYRWVWI